MIPSFKFGRLDKHGQANNFRYETRTDKDADWHSSDTEMTKVGAHYSVSIRNYLREPLYVVDHIRSEPKIYASIYANNKYLLEDTNNLVIIEIRFREIEHDKDGRGKVKTQRKIDIRCPGHLLQNNSVFVEELGCFLTIGSRLDATRELIAQDARFAGISEVSVPEVMVKPNPVRVLSEYENLVKNCLERADRIQVRVGHRVDVDPDLIPEKVKNMRISVMDRDFSPYYNNRMVYDAALTDDEFVVENIHFVVSEPLISTFTILNSADNRSFFLDTQEHRTMNGVLCGLAIFADAAALHDYMFAHSAEKVYDELMEFVSTRDGSPVLKRRIESLEQEIKEKDGTIADLEINLKFERGQVKDLKRVNAAHEETIRKIQNHSEEELSFEAVMMELENEREKLKNDRERLEVDRKELENKLAISKQTQRASIFKSTAEIIKSSWGILVLAGTIGTALWQGWNKLKSVSA